ncbi:MAG: type I restriction endonuclease subunit R, partial [Methanobacteriota archaeon]
KWAQLEAVVGAEKRLAVVARDVVEHFETRLEAMDGKAMVVCMSRRICVELYDEIANLRPGWVSDDEAGGAMKVVMTGSASDPVTWQRHIRNKRGREDMAKRFKDPVDPLRLVIVRDMWLTGFDVPSLHTMYVDKPMRGHTLMQAIARVNRVFRDKPGGLIVDYLGLADMLRKALHDYSDSGGKGKTAVPQEEAVAKLLETVEVCEGIFRGFDRSAFLTGKPADRLRLIPRALEHLLSQPEGKERFLDAVAALSAAFALAVPHKEALRVKDDVAFFQAVRAALKKASGDRTAAREDVDAAVRQIVSKAVATDEVIDIFSAAGLKKPDLSILSDEFLAEVRRMPHRNLAVEVLRNLLNDEIKARSRHNLVQSRRFSEMLERAVRAYHNRAIETVQVIEDLIALAKEMKAAERRGEELRLSKEETAFYDALEVSDSAVKVLGDAILQQIARELADTIRKNATIDWTTRASAKASLRVLVKRLLRKHGYPPDRQERATQTVMEQAELLASAWAPV